MRIEELNGRIPSQIVDILEGEGIDELRPCQEKAISAGLLDAKNLLVCTPTASGKTLVGELGILKSVVERGGKAIYIVPLKALASEKFKEFKRKYAGILRVALSIGDLDSSDPYLQDYHLIICTAEKLDSLIRHSAPWLREVSVVVVDEIHLLNDPTRGPTLEILITLLKKMLKSVQLIGLSATIGNEKELAEWLGAELVHDTWRPVDLHKGVILDGKIEFSD